MARPLSPGKLLLQLLEQTATPLFVLDGKRRILFASRALGSWLGMEPEQLVGLRCDYHAGGDDSLSQVACALCPPPEAFVGDVEDGSVSRLATASLPFERRPARFVRLAGASDDELILLVFVLPSNAARSTGPEGALSAERLHGQLVALRGKLGKRFSVGQLIGVSDQITRVRQQVRIAAESRTRAIVVGPPGSGKEQVARTIHYSQSNSQLGQLVPIACPLVDAEQMQATLTALLRRQHAAPAAPPPVALLLDVDRLSAGAQQELAGFLTLPDIDLHTLATARSSLPRRARRGKFRPDLACLLSTLTIVLPPLRQRQQDIPLLAQHFLEEFNATAPHQLSGFQPAAIELLAGLPWPGDVEELAKAVGEACQSASGFQVTLTDLPPWVRSAQTAAIHPRRPLEAIHLDDFLAEIEKELLARALRASRGNKSKAAALLGISRPRLLRRLEQLGFTAAAAPEEPVVFEPHPEGPLHPSSRPGQP